MLAEVGGGAVRSPLARTERRFKKRGVDNRVFVNQPRQFIRGVPADCEDQLYCRQLANAAVDGALAGYTGCSISRWLDHYVMVPFARTAEFRKHLPLDGLVWKQVVDQLLADDQDSRRMSNRNGNPAT